MIDPRPCPHRHEGVYENPAHCPRCMYSARQIEAETRTRMHLAAQMVERAHQEGRPQHLTASSDGRRIIEVRCDANGHPVAMIVVLP